LSLVDKSTCSIAACFTTKHLPLANTTPTALDGRLLEAAAAAAAAVPDGHVEGLGAAHGYAERISCEEQSWGDASVDPSGNGKQIESNSRSSTSAVPAGPSLQRSQMDELKLLLQSAAGEMMTR
jgi:hypothetical protein